MQKMVMFNSYYSNIVKGIAIVLMLIHHNYYIPEMYINSGTVVLFDPFGEYVTTKISLWCKICVALFVFITGFGITRKCEYYLCKQNFTVGVYIRLCISRLYKLFFNYWFIFLLALIYSGITGQMQFSKSYSENYVKEFLIDWFGFASLLHTNTFNPTWWYVSLAIILIVTVPVIYFFYKKYGYKFCICIWFFSLIIGEMYYYPISRYMIVAIMGIIFADKCWFDNFMIYISNCTINKKIMILLFNLFIIITSFYFTFKLNYFYTVGIYDCLGVLGIISVLCISHVDFWFAKLGEFLGRHSMNIFYFHTFIYYFWYNEFIYSFQYPVFITSVLLLICLAVSIVIEYIKKITGFKILIEVLK